MSITFLTILCMIQTQKQFTYQMITTTGRFIDRQDLKSKFVYSVRPAIQHYTYTIENSIKRRQLLTNRS